MPTPFALTTLAGSGSPGQDRAICLRVGGGIVIGVADGAGGISGGSAAAEEVICDLRNNPPSPEETIDPAHWRDRLRRLDHHLYEQGKCGETTAVVLGWREGRLAGASVGDSEIWLIGPDSTRVLTRHQPRRPFLGTGVAAPRAFRVETQGGRILAATDGLFRYANAEQIQTAATSRSPESALDALVDLVRLPSATLRDDLAIVVCDLSAEYLMRAKF
jgi:serine/threonine protein phosphatase PrpC